MSIFIRACFCLEHHLSLADLSQLTEILATHNCGVTGLPKMNLGEWVDQSFVWNTQIGSYKARLFQLYPSQTERSLFSFEVDSLVFLPGRSIVYRPYNDHVFMLYKLLLADLIQRLVPIFGAIDYDADLLCGEINLSAFVAWGNYFSTRILDSWSLPEKELLSQIVDEIVPINSIGSLTFIHPLMANQAWSDRHNELAKLIKSHNI